MLNFSREKCNGCGLCVRDCMTCHSIMLDESNKAKKILSDCISCYHCVAICPNGAITIKNTEPLETKKYRPTFTSNEYLDFLKNKRSIRQYKDKSVERSKIEQIVEAGIYSPTAGNKQPVNYAVVTGDSLKELTKLSIIALKKLADDYNLGNISLNLDSKSAKGYTSMWQRFYREYFEKGIDELFFNAPCLLLILGDKERNLDPKTDCVIAACNIGNMIYASGLGFCYNGFFVRAYLSEEVRKFIGIDSKYDMHIAMTIGYPSVEYSRDVPREKKEIFWI